MTYVTTKPTLYLIDGLNLVRSFLWQFARTEEDVTEEFLDFLEEVSCDEKYCMHEYRVVFDGAYRPIGPLYRAGVHIVFSEQDTADDYIYQEAYFLAQQGRRVIAVTSDKDLQNRLKEIGVKTLFCQKFYNGLKLSHR
ncbi:MAG: NYN domain-containing protein [Elusimicrobiaceae bacterium]|nr:NYN domain-containing protein [Elusimicrobiaceae bacterium]